MTATQRITHWAMLLASLCMTGPALGQLTVVYQRNMLVYSEGYPLYERDLAPFDRLEGMGLVGPVRSIRQIAGADGLAGENVLGIDPMITYEFDENGFLLVEERHGFKSEFARQLHHLKQLALEARTRFGVPEVTAKPNGVTIRRELNSEIFDPDSGEMIESDGGIMVLESDSAGRQTSLSSERDGMAFTFTSAEYFSDGRSQHLRTYMGLEDTEVMVGPDGKVERISDRNTGELVFEYRWAKNEVMLVSEGEVQLRMELDKHGDAVRLFGPMAFPILGDIDSEEPPMSRRTFTRDEYGNWIELLFEVSEDGEEWIPYHKTTREIEYWDESVDD